MNYRPQGRGAIPGRLLGDGRRGSDAGSPAPFVMTNGGIRRARPAWSPDRPASGLGKLFPSLTGLVIDYGQRALWPGPARFPDGARSRGRPADDTAGGQL